MEIQQNVTHKNETTFTGKQKHTTAIRKLADIEPQTAARLVGWSWVIMFILAIPAVLFVLEALVVNGDTAASLDNIKGNEILLYAGIVTYFIILTLDATIAIGLYSVLKFTHQRLALIMSILRLLFVAATAVSLIGLALLQIQFYSIGVLVGYGFLIPHLFFLGYLTTRSWYLSKYLGWFLMTAAFAYVITMFGEYILPTDLYDLLYPTAMIPASLAEISMGIYLIRKAKSIADRIDF